MKTCCCSSHCKKYLDCQLADINNEGMNVVENYHEWGSGTFTDKGCVIEHYCGELGNYKMFEQISHSKKLKRYLAYLDEINDFLDEEDEIAGIPMGIGKAWEELESYLAELYMLNLREKH